MTVYWDTSAIVRYYATGRMDKIAGVTRTHTLAEIFSTLTGGGFMRLMPDGSLREAYLKKAAADAVLQKIRPHLEFVELSADEVLKSIHRSKGIQGGRIHDLLHAAAAEKAEADELWTTDLHDFAGLGKVELKIIS